MSEGQRQAGTPRRLQIEAHEGVRSIDAARWDALAAPAGPFLKHALLSLMEDAGCVGEGSGWTPMILTLTDADVPGGPLLGAAPLYLKMHSAGEFVFDWGWADAAQRAGIAYYPKAVVAVPFTPVTGQRLLVAPGVDDPDAIVRALAAGAIQVANSMGLSSVHFNFLTAREAALLSDMGLHHRLGLQYHWYNDRRAADPDPDALADTPRTDHAPYDTFDDFLARFRSKRRANIRRERRKLAEGGVTTRVVRGGEATGALMQRMFRYYKATIDKFYWGRQYLNPRFFEGLPDALGDALHMVLIEADGRDFGGTLNLCDDQRLYGRYWGCRREVDYAHFEACMYAPIDWCIAHNIQVFEPGAGGEHKYERGFTPTFTHSAHYLANPNLSTAVADFLTHERATLTRELRALRLESPLA